MSPLQALVQGGFSPGSPVLASPVAQPVVFGGGQRPFYPPQYPSGNLLSGAVPGQLSILLGGGIQALLQPSAFADGAAPTTAELAKHANDQRKANLYGGLAFAIGSLLGL